MMGKRWSAIGVPALALLALTPWTGGRAAEALGARFPWERKVKTERETAWAQEGLREMPVPRKRPAKSFYRNVRGKGPYIAFTFDDGPRPWTAEVLDALKERNLKGTFFVVGTEAQLYASLIKRMIAEGHEVANHTLTHKDNYLHRAPHSRVEREVRGGHEVIAKVAGVAPRVFRPPGGNFTEEQTAWIHDTFGYANISWSVDPRDGGSVKPSPAVFKRRILSQVYNGAIILSHDLHQSTVAAIPATLDALVERGYQFLTVSELLALDDPYEVVKFTEREFEWFAK